MIIPVLDIKGSDCVSGKSGNRDSYTKLKSVYGDNVLDIAKNLKDSGAKLLYVADLDKLENKGDNSFLISKINEIIPVMLDNAISSLDDVIKNEKISAYSILATESMESLSETIEIFKKYDNKRLVISVDIKNNELLLKNNDIKFNDIISLIDRVKPQYTILLNISQVGTKKDDDNQLVRELIKKTPNTKHIIAGGLNNQRIKYYKENGINDFLIGTILHEGSLKYNL